MDESVGEILYDGMHQLVAGSPAQKEAHPENKTQVLFTILMTVVSLQVVQKRSKSIRTRLSW